jgi:hypothetical protein
MRAIPPSARLGLSNAILRMDFCRGMRTEFGRRWRRSRERRSRRLPSNVMIRWC